MNSVSKSKFRDCSQCNFYHSNPPPFLTATKEELNKRPPLPKEFEDDLRVVARILRKRVEEDWEEEQLQTPLKNPTLKEAKENGNTAQ